MQSRLKVSVVATVLNEEQSIGVLIESLLGQTRPPDEIVLVDGGSRDATVAVIERYIAAGASLRLLIVPGANISVGRNRGIAAAKHDLIAVTDAGVRLELTWLERLIAPFVSSDGATVDVVSGFFRAAPTNTFELALGATTLPLVDEIDPRKFLPSSRSVAFRRGVWERVGGYPEWLDYGEDLVFDLALRAAGARFTFAPEAIAHFRPRPDLRAFFFQYYRYARGDGKADLWRRRHAIRYTSYTVGALALLLGIWYKGAWLALLAASLAYLYQPYRRLWLLGRKWPCRNVLCAGLLVPVIRAVGDVAKMIGYPVGIWWRLNRGLASGDRAARSGDRYRQL